MKINEDFTRRSKLLDLGRWHITEFVRSVAARLPPGTRRVGKGKGEHARSITAERQLLHGVTLATAGVWCAWNCL